MKKLLSIVISMLMLSGTLAGCATNTSTTTGAATTAVATTAAATTAATTTTGAADTTAAPIKEGNYKIGFAFYNLSNPVWAEVVQAAVDYGAENGCEVTYVDAGEDSSKQISQIENFIQSGMDAICVLAIDPTSVEDVCKKAMDAGIKVVDYSRGVKNAYCSLNLDPIKDAAAMIAMITPFIKEKYGDAEFEWAHLDIPTVEVGVVQGNAIEADMLAAFPNSKLVFNGATLTTEQGLNNTQALLQANPDVRVIISQSAGGGVGGNEAIKAAVSPDQYGDYLLFSIDATEQELMNIMNGDPEKGSIGLGGGAAHGRAMIDLSLKLLKGDTIEYLQSLPITPVTAANAQEYFDLTYKK